MTFKTSKLSKAVVKPVAVKHEEASEIGGYDFIPKVSAVVSICAPPRCGKTTTLATLLKKCIGKKTTVFAFGPTINHDPTWIKIKDDLEKRKITIHAFTHFIDGKENILQDIIDQLIESSGDDDEETKKPVAQAPQPIIMTGITDCIGVKFDKVDEKKLEMEVKRREEREKKREERKKKGKKVYPKFCFVFDDLAESLRAPVMMSLTCKYRHFVSKVIILNHTMTCLTPNTRSMVSYLLVFKGMNDEKLEALWKDSNVHTSFDEFKRLYDFATEKPYSFLFYDKENGTFRRNFNEAIEM